MTLLISFILAGLMFSNPVLAQEYSASPSAQPRQSLTPSPTVVGNLCNEVKVVRGNQGIAPQTVLFETVPFDALQITGYRYHFGDGAIEDGGREIEHRYTNGGEFTVFVEVKDISGKWQSSSACQTTITLKNPPLISGKVACGEVVILSGNNAAAPSEVIVQVNGKGVVEDVRQYRVDFGDGAVEEGVEKSISHTYLSPGTYQIKGYVKDGMGVMYGGTEACVKTVKILSAAPLTVQPETGVSLYTWYLILGMAVLALILRIYAYASHHAE